MLLHLPGVQPVDAELCASAVIAVPPVHWQRLLVVVEMLVAMRLIAHTVSPHTNRWCYRIKLNLHMQINITESLLPCRPVVRLLRYKIKNWEDRFATAC